MTTPLKYLDVSTAHVMQQTMNPELIGLAEDAGIFDEETEDGKA